MTDKLMAKTAHVARRGAVYYFRLRVPADLLEHYRKNEITFSLKTKDPAETKLKAAVEGLHLQGEFSVTRKARDANLVESMSPEEIRQASLAFAHAVLSDDEDQRRAGRVPVGHRIAIEELENHARPTVAGDTCCQQGTMSN